MPRKSWTFHRPTPTTQPKALGARNAEGGGQPPSGRWTFHDPAAVAAEPAMWTGWRIDDDGATPLGQRWTCDFQQPDGAAGCKSFVWTKDPLPGQFHAWDCPYWQSEHGRHHTPF